MSSTRRMWCKTVLLIAVSLTFCFVKTTGVQEQSVEKRGQGKMAPITLADVIKVMMEIQKRMNDLELKRSILLRGRDGRDGTPGKDGRDGLPGRPGVNYGLPGKPGPKGEPGRQGVRGPAGANSGGVQFVRWGRTTCPTNTSIVYKGRIGGEHYSHTGGGTNYVCLPETPKYGRYKPGRQNLGVYGTEYQVGGLDLFTKSNLHNHDAPCAVCYVKTRSAKLMIPATYECPAGWIREYHGYLMSAYHNHPHSSEFICVDNDAEAVPGTHADLDGALLYPVEGVCGSLPCHPYVDGRELTCAVCTK